jgi:hypothetical protein
MSKNAWLGATVACALLVSGAASAANLVTNGSFENGSFTDNTGQDTDSLPLGSTAMTGWTVSGSEGLAWIGPTNPFGLTASDGSYFLDLTGYSDGAPFSGVTQTISTVAGAHYSLTFDLGSSTNWGIPDGITASAGSTSGTFTSTNTTSTNAWESETLNFTAAGTSTAISLLGEQGDAYIGLDDVSVVETSGPIPEPATWVMLIGGMAAVGAAARRRRSPASAAVA